MIFDEVEEMKEFLTNLYYEIDTIAMFDRNCFDYEKGELDYKEFLSLLKENNVKFEVI